MKHRTFGRSGIQVPEVAFGAGAEGGINRVDTAAAYGNGKSEAAPGWLLPKANATPAFSDE